MSFLPGLKTLWDDLLKIFAFAPVVAAVDPNAAAGVSEAAAAIQALQPTVKAVQDAANGTLGHAELVAKVTDAVAASSAQLAQQGLLSSTDNDHVQAAVPLIHAAVAISGLAAPTAK